MAAILGAWRLLQQDGEHATEIVDLAGTVLAHLIPEPAGAEALHQGQSHLVQQGDDEELAAADMEEGLPDDHAVAVPNLGQRQHRLGRGLEHAMGDQHSLRPAGGAGGVADIEQGGCPFFGHRLAPGRAGTLQRPEQPVLTRRTHQDGAGEPCR